MNYRTARLSPASTLVVLAVVAWVAHPAAVSVRDPALQAVVASAADMVVDPPWAVALRSSFPT